jgi:hypothetical protein
MGPPCPKRSTWTKRGCSNPNGPAAPSPLAHAAKEGGGNPNPKGVPWGASLPLAAGPRWDGAPPLAPCLYKEGGGALGDTPRALAETPPCCSSISSRARFGEALFACISTIATTPSRCWLRSHLLLRCTCWIKEEESSPSCTCAHLGGTARCGADRIGTREELHRQLHRAAL